MKMISVDEALTIVTDLALEHVPSNALFIEAWQIVVAYQLLNLRGKPFPLSTGS